MVKVRVGHHPTIQPERSAEVYEDFCIEQNFFEAQQGFVSRLTSVAAEALSYSFQLTNLICIL